MRKLIILSALFKLVIGQAFGDDRPDFLCEYTDQNNEKIDVLIVGSGATNRGSYNLTELDEEALIQELPDGRLHVGYQAEGSQRTSNDSGFNSIRGLYQLIFQRDNDYHYYASFYFRHGIWNSILKRGTVFINKRAGEARFTTRLMREDPTFGSKTFAEYVIEMKYCREVASIDYSYSNSMVERLQDEVVQVERSGSEGMGTPHFSESSVPAVEAGSASR